MKLNQLSLATRNALIYFVLFIVGLGVSSYILFSYSAKEILSLTEENLEHNGEVVSLKFDSYINQVESDLNQLAYSPLLLRYIDETSRGNLDLLTDEYTAFLKSKSTYFQVRLISVNSGEELIRVERKEERIINADFTDLQNKKDRDYFVEILGLSEDSIFFSKIDLNKEYNEISQPITPTMRIAKRLSTDSLGGVIVILNVDLNQLFSDLKESLPNNYELRVVNAQGHYLIHPVQQKEFTFEYDLNPFYYEEYNQNPSEIIKQDAVYTTEESLAKFINLHYQRADYQLTAIISAQNDTIFASFYSWRKKVLWVSISIALVFLLMAFIYLRRQVRELKTITNELMHFTDNRVPQKLAIDRKDEIGELARGFELMSNRVSESYALIEKARNEAQLAFDEKNEFLENMSHEIRNPLQSILGTVQILEQNQVGTHQIPYINALKFSANQLRSLVTDVLDYGKIKRNQIELAVEWINLDEFCSDLIKALKYQALSKKIELTYSAFEGIRSKNYQIDPTRLYQVLNNLIINAIKFTPSGGQVKLELAQGEGNTVRFNVIDNGKGIEDAEIRKILDRSYASDYVSGVGLGLTIVQHLLTIFKATLAVESEFGKGSVFRFDLNLAVQLGADAEEVADMTCWSNVPNRPKVLVLEDDPIQNDWYAFVFNVCDLTIINSPRQLIFDVSYDLILSDLHFEEENSLMPELEKHLLTLLHPNGKLIFVSGEPSKNDFKSMTWLKPIRKELVWTQLDQLFSELNYGKPQFKNFERDYDQNTQLIKNALNVLVSEWKKDQLSLVYALNNRDKDKFDQINHRIVTSVRRLELERFEHFLNHLSKEIYAIESEQLAHESQKLDRLFDHFIAEINAH